MGNSSASIEPLFGGDLDPDDVPWVMLSYDPGRYYKGFHYYHELQVYSNRPDRVNTLTTPPCPPTADIHSNITDHDHIQKNVRSIQIRDGMTIEHLVKCLTDMYKGKITEADKVKILYNWLTAQNIKFSEFRLTHNFCSVDHQLQKLQDKKNSHAAFFSLLCYFAGIPCVILKGHVKREVSVLNGMSDNDIREWNAVFVDNQWRLVDSYWGRIYRSGINETDEFFLFTNPEHAKYSHFPNNSVWQLLEVPIKQHQFLEQPVLKPRFFQMKLEILNCTNGNIKCITNEEIKLIFLVKSKIKKDTKFCTAVSIHNRADKKWTFLKPVSANNEPVLKYSNRKTAVQNETDIGTLPTLDPKLTDNNIVRKSAKADRNDTITQVYLLITVSLPEAGYYKIEIIGRSNSALEYDRVAVYTIEVEDIGAPVEICNSPETTDESESEDIDKYGELASKNENVTERIQKIKVAHIVNIKSYKYPSYWIEQSIKALLILLGKQEKELTTWDKIKIHLKGDIIGQIKNFDQRSVSAEAIQKAKDILGKADIMESIHLSEDVAAVVYWMKAVFENVEIHS